MMSLQCDLKWSKSTWWLIKSVSQPIKTLIQVIIHSRLFLLIKLFWRNHYSYFHDDSVTESADWSADQLVHNFNHWKNDTIYANLDCSSSIMGVPKSLLGFNWTSSYCYEILAVFELISFNSLNDISTKSNCQHIAHLEQICRQHWKLKIIFRSLLGALCKLLCCFQGEDIEVLNYSWKVLD